MPLLVEFFKLNYSFPEPLHLYYWTENSSMHIISFYFHFADSPLHVAMSMLLCSSFYYVSLANFIIMNAKPEQTLEFFSQHVLNLQEILLNNFGFFNCGFKEQYSLMFLILLQTYLNYETFSPQLNSEFHSIYSAYNIIRNFIIIVRQISQTLLGLSHRIKALLRGLELLVWKYFALLCSQLSSLIPQIKRFVCQYLILTSWPTQFPPSGKFSKLEKYLT